MKKGKKITLYIFIAAVVLLIAYSNTIRLRIINKVKRNIDRYTVAADEMLSGARSSEISLNSIKDISVWNDVQVDFTCEYGGFGSQSSYYGFYYSVDDIPRTFQGVNVTFEAEGNGMKWNEENSDNWCYVEKIYDHWYYFEMHF